MARIRLGLHLHPPPRQSLDAFVDTVKRVTEYFLERFAVAGSPADIVQRIRALARPGLTHLWMSSPGDGATPLDLLGTEVLPRLNDGEP